VRWVRVSLYSVPHRVSVVHEPKTRAQKRTYRTACGMVLPDVNVEEKEPLDPECAYCRKGRLAPRLPSPLP
jgi:hypothetical protein